MTTTLRDAMAAARINRMKGRMARAWAQRQREAASADHPVCEGCGKQHAPENASTPEPAPGPSRCDWSNSMTTTKPALPEPVATPKPEDTK